MEIDIWEMFKNAIASGNWIITIIVGIIILAYLYVQNKKTDTAEIAAAVTKLAEQISDNFANDLAVKQSLEANTAADKMLAERVDAIEQNVEYLVNLTGREQPTE